MSTYIPGPRAAVVPASGRAVLAGWALGLAVAGPLLVLVSVVGSGLDPGTAGLTALGSLLAPPSVLLAFVLGLVALSRARHGHPGHGLAVSAIVISAAQIALVVVTLVATFLMVAIVFALGGS